LFTGQLIVHRTINLKIETFKNAIRKLVQALSVTVAPAEPFPHKCVPTVGHRDLLDLLFKIREGCGFAFTLTRRGTRQAQVNERPQPIHPMTQNKKT